MNFEQWFVYYCKANDIPALNIPKIKVGLAGAWYAGYLHCLQGGHLLNPTVTQTEE